MKFKLRKVSEPTQDQTVSVQEAGDQVRVGQGSQARSAELQFPLGYEGLPMAQVEAAEAINSELGITDPVHRKYNVLTWVQGYYQDRGENHGEHYQAIEQEKQRIGKILEQDGIGT